MDDRFELELRRVFSKHKHSQPSMEFARDISELMPVESIGQQWMIDNDEMRIVISGVIMPAVMGRWLQKNEDYRGAQMFLGVKAQFIDINRKFWKLFHIVWEGHKPEFETEAEIKMDMIGHLLMSLYLEDPETWKEVLRRAQYKSN